jgi:diguanylate cyclase (GGDEF)-like protein
MLRNRTRFTAEWTYGLLGILLGLGAPTGQLIVRITTSAAVRAAPLSEVRMHGSFYGYQLLATCIVFCLAGIAAGRRAERLRRAQEFYHRLSERDPLTGLLNARSFGERFARVAERAARLGQPVSMLLVDVDGLKEINDRHGHAAGNDALMHVAATIDQTKRSEDEAARWGGDEFAILMESGDADAASRVAEAILARLRLTSLSIGRQQRVVTATIGIATAVQPFEPEVLFAAADEALYDGKSRGRNRIAAAPPS